MRDGIFVKALDRVVQALACSLSKNLTNSSRRCGGAPGRREIGRQGREGIGSPLPTKATHQRTREHNVRLASRTLYELEPISRADIARQTHLTRTTVGDVITAVPMRAMA